MFFFEACMNDDSTSKIPLFAEEGEELSGGSDFTNFITTNKAFGLAGSTLDFDEKSKFAFGRSFFRKQWVTAPSSTGARDGLGPFFNSGACANCHLRDGSGLPPAFKGDLRTGLLFRLSIGNNELTGKIPHPVYGGQLQNRAILGQTPEGGMHIVYTPISGTYPDGTSYTLRKPTYSVDNPAYGSLRNVKISPRIAPKIMGMGLLGAISEADILAHADPGDSDGDGISGKANYVWSESQKKSRMLGRYGWKANVATLADQDAGAFNGDMGITSPVFPDENYPTVPGRDFSSIPSGGSPEINKSNFDQLVFYSAVISVTARRNWKEPNVLRGKQIFNELKCAVCHVPKYTTGSNLISQKLANQVIRPYTDLLLHDMGEGLADHAAEFKASGSEWRTTPLWGLGLVKKVSGNTFLLHDGRARNITEAILWHGGEAEKSKEEFTKLSKEERQDLLDFLNSL